MPPGGHGWEKVFHPAIAQALANNVVPEPMEHLIGGNQQSENHETMLLGLVLLRAALLDDWARVAPMLDVWLERNERELWVREPLTGSHGNQHLEGAACILRACKVAEDAKRRDRVLALLSGLLYLYRACDPHGTGESIYPGARSTGEARGKRAWTSNGRQSGAGRTLYRWVFFGSNPGPIEKKGGADVGAMIALEVGKSIRAKDVTKPAKLRGGPLVVQVFERGHVASLPNIEAFRACRVAWGRVEGRKLVDAGYDVEPPDLGAALREVRAA